MLNMEMLFLQTWDLSKILHRRIFRPKILHCQFHLISTVLVIETQKMSKWRNLHRWQKFYTPDGRGKSHLKADDVEVVAKFVEWILAPHVQVSCAFDIE